MHRPGIRLGRSPLEVVPLGVGCWAWGDRPYWRYDESSGRGVVDAFDASLAAGIDFFDTAESYGWGKSEKILGTLIRRSGATVRLATKYAPMAGRGGPSAIRAGLAGSLKRLGVSKIDLYQLHWADRTELPIGATMNVLADLVEEGRIGAVGVSNYSAGEMREAHAALARRGVPLASNQVHYSLLHRTPEIDGVLAACRELEVALLAYSPLEQGLLTGKYAPGRRPSGGRSEAVAFSDANVVAAQSVVEHLGVLAHRHGVTAAAIAIAWLLAKPGVVPIAGARDGDQASANARGLDVRLAPDELAVLDELTEGWRR